MPGLRRRMMQVEERRVIWWVVVCAGFALVVKARWLAGFDAAVANWAQGMRTPDSDAAAAAITFFGSSTWALAAGIVMTGWWARLKRWRQIGAFWVSWGVGLVVQSVARCWVVQWRPDTYELVSIHWIAARLVNCGFTSGHAFRSAFILGWWGQVLARKRSRWARTTSVACTALMLLVGMSRVYLNRHWVTDVVGGWVVAAFAIALAELLARGVAKTGQDQV